MGRDVKLFALRHRGKAGQRIGFPINRLGFTVDYDELDIFNRLIGPVATLGILLEAPLSAQEYDVFVVSNAATVAEKSV